MGRGIRSRSKGIRFRSRRKVVVAAHWGRASPPYFNLWARGLPAAILFYYITDSNIQYETLWSSSPLTSSLRQVSIQCFLKVFLPPFVIFPGTFFAQEAGAIRLLVRNLISFFSCKVVILSWDIKKKQIILQPYNSNASLEVIMSFKLASESESTV